MPVYVDDPDNSGKQISSIELQKRSPRDVRPPVLIHGWMKRDLWTRHEAVQLLAGCCPTQDGLNATAPLRFYLDGTNDETLRYGDIPPPGWPDRIDPTGDYPNLTHPLRYEIMENLLTLNGFIAHCDLNETKSPQSWIDWANTKGVVPYWLKYAGPIQSVPVPAPAAAPEATPAKAPGVKTNKKAWDDEKLRALLEESFLPGVTTVSLASKHGVSRQRISTLLKNAKERFGTPGSSSKVTNPWGQLVKY